MANAEDMRLAVASQPTVPQAIVLLLRGLATAANKSLMLGDPTVLKSLADSIGNDIKSWSDAVLANTSSAPMTASVLEPIPVQTHVAGDFAPVQPPEQTDPQPSGDHPLATHNPVQTGSMEERKPDGSEEHAPQPGEPNYHGPANAPPHGE